MSTPTTNPVPAHHPECLLCHVYMELGFMVDRADGGSAVQASWSPGAPIKNWFNGIKSKQKKSAVPVVTYRCPACGRLESFALLPSQPVTPPFP
ncbi:MAG TPA: hypothetical protein VG797_09290 [Phycisphaerales bacterium]|nr:hypothetical protein [Phycisphaerales bacterium]